MNWKSGKSYSDVDPRKIFQLIEIVGKGSFGLVYKG